jgi:hypothetical protein
LLCGFYDINSARERERERERQTNEYKYFLVSKGIPFRNYPSVPIFHLFH